MLFLSINGWINGLSSLFIIILGWSLGIHFILSSRRQKSKLLRYFGFLMVFYSNTYISYVTDFFSLLLTDKNPWGLWTYTIFSEVDLLTCLTTWMWVSPMIYVAALIGAEFTFPQKKNYIKIMFLITVILYEIFLFLDYGNNLTEIPEVNPGDLADAWFTFGSPIFIIGIIWGVLLFMFNGVGIILRSLQAKGLIRKKLLIIAFGFILLILIISVFEGLTTPGPFLILNRSLMIFSWVLLYYGIKPQKEKRREKKAPSKEVAKFASYMLGKPKAIDDVENVNASNVELEKKLLVFMSYATKDVDTFKIHDIAKRLMEFSEIENVLYWEEYMEDNIFEYMDENLDKCDAMILFCSEHARDSIPVKKEWTAAEALSKPIIPVFYNPHHIPALLSSRLGIQFDFYDLERNVQELRSLILKKVGGLTE